MTSCNSKILLNNSPLKFTLILFSVFTLFFFLPVFHVWAENHNETLSMSGVVKAISLTEHTLVVKPEEDKRQRIVFTEKTLYKGVHSAKEIKVKDKVRIWYVQEKGLLKALKIKVMPELGC